MQGSLNEDTLPTVLRRLYASGKSGILHVSRDGMSKRVYFRQGAISFAGSDIEEERLGESLLRAGSISRSDLKQALQIVKQTGQRLGKILVEMGLTLPGEIHAIAAKRMKAIIYSLLAWDSGEYRFEERESPVEEDMAINESLAELILEGIRRIQNPATVRRLLGHPNAILHWPGTASLPYEESTLTPQERMVLDLARTRVDGVSTAADIAAVSPLREEEILRCLYGFVSVGVLEVEPGPVSARPASGSDEIASSRTRTLVIGDSAEPLANLVPDSFSPESLPKRLGRYEIQEVLGRGSMGTVLSGRDPMIDRTVAIKLIQTAVQLTAAQLEKYRERFYREAKAAGKLLHPGIVMVFDVGHTEEQTPFIVMEYVQGKTLQKVLDTENLELADALQMALEILDALAYAHSQGVVHRDIKTANILVTPDRHVKVMDFGVAHVVGSGFTEPDEVVGSLDYMAPEQLSKGPIDQRTDLFAFGVVLYRMLTGKLPFGGDSFSAIVQTILSEEPVSPDRINPAVPPALAGIVLRCLAKDAARRFSDAEAIREAVTSLGIVDGSRVADQEMAGSIGVRYFYRAMGVVSLLGVALAFFFAFSRGNTVLQTGLPARGDPLQSGERKPSEKENSEEGNERKDPTGQEDSPLDEPERPGGDEAPGGQGPSEAELFIEARAGLSRGDFGVSKAKLEALLQRNPGFPGAPELLVELNEQLWKEANLPMSFQATHNHRIGHCAGTLSLEAWGIRYRSDKHEWQWSLDEIRIMERETSRRLSIETYDKDILVLGKLKKYNFSLSTSLTDDAWTRYQRLAK